MGGAMLPQFVIKIFYIFYRKPFIKFFKTLIFKRSGLYTNNFTKSLMFHTISNLNKMTLKSNTNSFSPYLNSISIVNFSFHKNVYNTLIIYILYLLTHLYVNNFTNFSLYYTYILIPKHFYILNFCNNYYFKIHHY